MILCLPLGSLAAACVNCVESCLAAGRWARTRTPSNRSLADMLRKPPGWKHPMEFKAKGANCPGFGALPPRREWRPTHLDCDGVLDSPSDGRFGGVFSDTARPVQLMLMGDSVSAQWLSALVGAAASNPALHALSFARGEAEASRRLMPFNMRLLPHTVQAGLYMLRAIRWPSRSGGSADVAAVQPRRIVLVNPGPHYHIGPLCAFPRFTNNTKICELVKTDRDNGHQTSLREDDPTRCTVGPAVRKHAPPWWGLCNAVRQASGLASVDAFKEDLNAFVRAAAAWQRETPDALVVWLEMAPQHFWPSSGVNGGPGFKGNAGKVAGCKDDCCSATPLQYLPPLDAWHSDIRARCAMVHSLDDVATAPPACREALANWQNVHARPVLKNHGVPIVPIMAALQSRADLHPPTDCTHYCEPSEGTLHVVKAILSTIAQVIRGRELRQEREGMRADE